MTVPLGNPYSLGNTGVQTAARTDRLALGAAFRPGSAALSDASGVLHGPAGTRGDLTLLTDVLVRIDPFLAIVQGTHNTQQGQYVVPNLSTRDLAVPAKDASLFRRALVQVRVADSLEAGVASSAATDGSWLEVSSGALAASNPALPATPANALLLGELSIPSTASGQPVTLTRYYPRTVARGASLPLPTEAMILALPVGLLWPGFSAYAEDTGANAVYDGTRWLFYDTRWQTYTPVVAHGTVAGVWTQGNSTVLGRYFRTGRRMEVEGDITLGSTASFGGTPTSSMYVTMPPGYVASLWSAQTQPVGVCWIANGQAVFGFSGVNPIATAADRRFVFYNAAGTALTGAAGGAGSWTIYAATHGIRWRASYETAFEA